MRLIVFEMGVDDVGVVSGEIIEDLDDQDLVVDQLAG